MIPAIGQKFDAYVLWHGNRIPHRCSPFTCTRADLGWVYGTDDDGDEFEFRKSKFIFKEVKE